MAEMIHYSNPQSRGMRTQVLLEHYDIPHRTEVIDFQSGQNRDEAYLKIHPYGRVPALQDGDLTLVESGAITLYLADKYADKMGTPAVGTPERARMYEWLFFFQTSLEPVAIQAFSSEDKTEYKGKVKELLQAMESRYKGPHALGKELTLLDIIIVCELTWYKMIGLYPDGLKLYDKHLAEVAPKLRNSFAPK
jgi:glutathione S-transferase